MAALGVFQLASALAGIAASVLVLLIRRFGPASWFLVLFLLPASLSSCALPLAPLLPDWSTADAARLSFSFLVLAAPGGIIFCYTAGREYYPGFLRRRTIAFLSLACAAAVLSFLLNTVSYGPIELEEIANGKIALGPIGYVSALFLLITAIVGLASLEQTLRSADKKAQWEIKFLLLGIGASLGAIIYISLQILLYVPKHGVLPPVSLEIFPALFLFSCILIIISWQRSSGRGRIVVSHGFIYSSITLIGVGLYIIAASLFARWAGDRTDIAVPAEAILFLLSLLFLAAVLLWTSFRQRIRRWVRRNVLAGRYDYRQYWLEATERIRSSDPPEQAAACLAEITQKALGAVEVSVWRRLTNPNRLCLSSSRGMEAGALKQEVHGVVEALFDLTEPLLVDEADRGSWPAELSSFVAQTQASLLVPLTSDGRTVGILAAGSDRSGEAFDWEALEFMGVLARHAAGELHKAEFRTLLLEAKELEAFRTFSTFLLHDMKNYASTLSMMANSITRHHGNPNFQRDSAQAMFEIAGEMKRLCASLRTFSSELAANKKMGNLNDVVRKAADGFSPALAGRLSLDLGDVPALLLDPEEVSRVLHNLIVNAQEATAPEGCITLRTRRLLDVVELSVEDNGKGISSDFLQKELFHPFHSTKSDGLGIGLFQSKKIIEAHGGTIQVESEEGKGTRVRVVFPVPAEAPEMRTGPGAKTGAG